MSEVKSIKLTFTNAAEDLPRLVTAYGRAWGGEVALVLRPVEATGLFAWASRGKGRLWKDQGSDSPEQPTAEEPLESILVQVRQAQRSLDPQGAIALRGQWSGVLVCRETGPVVELVRGVSAYAAVRVQSSLGGWRWQVERKPRWFGEERSAQGQSAYLQGAIQEAMASALRLVSEACSIRDTRRRAALDRDYAVEHPVRPAKEAVVNPTDRFRPTLYKAKPEKPPKPPKAPPPAPVLVRSAAALLQHNLGLTQALLDDPSPQTAKQWVKQALAVLGLRAASQRTRAELRPGGGGGFAISLVLSPPEPPEGAQAGLALLEEALRSPSAPPLRVERWALEGAKAPDEAPAPRKRGKGQATPKAPAAPAPAAPDPRDAAVLASLTQKIGELDLSGLV